jgi:hypothetical protein
MFFSQPERRRLLLTALGSARIMAAEKASSNDSGAGISRAA